MRKALLAALLLAVSLVLSACSISVSGGGPDLDDEVDQRIPALTSSDEVVSLLEEPSSVGRVTLNPGEERLYLVTVPSNSAEALYAYADAEVDLWLYRGDESLYGTSHSSDYFAEGSAGLAMRAAGTELGTQAIDVDLACPGSCVVAENPGEGHVYVRVRNDGSTTTTFGLWVVLRDFTDTNEAFGPSNPEPFTDSVAGAIETLGDEDYYVVDNAGELFFEATTRSGIEFVAEVSDPFGEGSTRRIRPGESTDVDIGEEVRVYAENIPERAAVSGTSRFDLFF